jgi:hypothetical protein
MASINPIPTVKTNSCPACGDVSGKCRTFDDKPLVLCMVKDSAIGYRSFGKDKSNLWTQLVPESECERNDWKERKQAESSIAIAPETLNLSDRHAWYEKFLAKKSLSDRDRADLVSRGLSNNEIDTLPVISSEIGYAVVFRGLEETFIGAQWRLAECDEGGRYRWQNLPGGKYYPGTEELPIAVYKCDRPRGIALVEGTGIKPMIASKRLEMIAIGAAGGNHVSSMLQLQAVLSEYRNLPITIVPDAGDLINPHVMKRHARTVQELESKGLKVKFLWWNQLTKEHNDIDECAIEELEDARSVSLKALLTLQNDYAFAETLDQIDILERAIDNPMQRDWVVQNYAHEAGLKSKGFNGRALLQMAQARRDAGQELEVFDAHEILESTEKPRFLIAGHLLEGTVTVLGAMGGEGKTSLLYSFAKCIATGTDWNSYRTKQGRSLIVQTDEPKTNIKQKLEIANFQNSVPRGTVDFITKWRFTKFQQLADRIRKEKYAFVVIDSWTAAHAGMGIDLTRSNAGDNAYLLRDLAEETGCAIVIVHHLNAMGGLRDSTTLRDNVSEVWLLSKGSSEDNLTVRQRILSIEKSRSDLQGRYLLEQNPADYSWIHLGLKDDPDEKGVEPVISRVFQEMKANPKTNYSVASISKKLDCDFGKAQTELDRLHRQGAIDAKWTVWEGKGFWSYRFSPESETEPPKSVPVTVETRQDIIDESIDVLKQVLAIADTEFQRQAKKYAIDDMTRLKSHEKRIVWDSLSEDEQAAFNRIVV